MADEDPSLRSGCPKGETNFPRIGGIPSTARDLQKTLNQKYLELYASVFNILICVRTYAILVLKHHRLPRPKSLIRRQNNLQTINRIIQVICKIQILLNGFQKISLLQIT